MNVSQWLEEIKTAKKREKDFRKDGKEILDIYANEKGTPFNILYSNTETLLPALFSQVPRPVIERRFKDEDPLGKAVSEACQRMLEYLIDTDTDQYDKFETSITDATLDGLLPGRGITAVKYESDDDVSWETVCTDSIKWDRVYFGFAHKWSKVPWVAYELHLDKKEAKRLFKNKINKVKFTEGEDQDEEDSQKDENKEQGSRETAVFYQIWDKSDKTIKYICDQVKDAILKEEEDPLNLTGFFNCAKPIQFVRKSNDLLPTAPYKLYENQAKELNRIQSRLNRVIEAIKVRGVYNGTFGEEIEQIFKEEDNALLPTDKASALMEGGFDKNIWMLPVGELIAVAQQLIQARESAKHVIYEITGISDIVRGQSMASETLGAQKIKEAWGMMRLKRLQKEVQRYALDTMRLMLDIAIKKFEEKSWVKMTGLPFSTTEQKQQAQNIVEIARQQGIQDKNVEQAMMILQKPCWGDVLGVLKDHFSKSYRVDIETNSTLDVEATEDKKLIGEFMNALAQMMAGFANDKTLPFAAKKSIILSLIKRYRFGREVEDELKAMQEPQPEQSPEMEKAAKQLQQDKQKFEQERDKAGNMLDERYRKLEADEMQLAFDKKLAKLEIDHQAKLNLAQEQVNQSDAQSALKDLIANHKRDVQSMLDKHKTNVDIAISKAQPKEKEEKPGDIIIQTPDQPKGKIVKIVKTGDGEWVGETREVQ